MYPENVLLYVAQQEGDKPMQRKTPRLILREFEESDWKAVQAYQSDLLYTRYHA